MRRSRAALAILTIMLISLLVAGPASAGGPTSVLLVVPGTGRTASLYTGAADYAALAGLVGAFEAPGVAGTEDPSGTSHAAGTGVTLTWLMHDVQVWRVDRVYLGADGGAWISTQFAAGESGTITDSPLAWHAAARGKELAALLDRLGVSPNSRGDGNAPGGSPIGGGAGRDIAPPAATAQLLWGLAGLALGVALTVAGMRLVAKSRTARGEHATTEAAAVGPADWETVPPGPDSKPNWPLTDELASGMS